MGDSRIQLVASGDYLHTLGGEPPAALGFDAYAARADRIALTFLPGAPQSEATPAEGLIGADMLLMLGQHLPDASIAPAAKRLALVARAGVGVDKIDVGSLTRNGVLLFNVPDALTEGTAAGALTLMLAASRQIVAVDRLTREGRWDDRQYHRGREIYGKTLGVIGPGRIGAELIRLVQPFRMRSIAYSPRLTAQRAARIGAEPASLEALMRESDFVVLACPLTEETRGLVGAREIALMRRDAFLVNIARGPVIDQEALVAALRDRRIGGAGLDVFATQPLAADDPLASLANVVLTPHCVCDTYELRRDVTAKTLREILAFADGGWPDSVLNPEVRAHPHFIAKREALLKRLSGARRGQPAS
jgi:phosphoglycerate dehydrogenase-like enzyme